MDPRARAVYRVDVRSFFDTDADGLGDINGIAAKIDYIKELGADTLMLSPVFSGEGFMIDPEIGTADDLDALIDKAASRMIGTVLEMRTDMPLNDASDIDRASAAMRYWLDRGAMGIAVNTDALTASGDKRALHRAMCALNRNVFSLYPDCFTVGIGKNVPFEDAVQLTRTENRELLMQLYIPAHMAEAFSPASGSLGALFCGGDAKRFKHDADYYQVQGELKGGWFLNVWQFLLDYLLAFGALGLAGLAKKLPKTWGLYAAIIIAAVTRALSATLAGYMFWDTAFWPSLVYNGTYLIPDTLICIVLALLVAKPVMKILQAK